MNESLAPTPLGFIGLGEMGGGMALNLLKAGFPLLAYDTCREALDRIARSGARTAENLASVAGISNGSF